MRLKFHGELRKRYGAYFDMQAETIADAIEGFSRQAQWPTDMRVVVVGHNTPESLMETPDEVDLMPSLSGGGGKFGSILLGAALIGTAFLTGGATLAGAGLLTTTSALGSSLLVSGTIMILQGVVGLFMKAPKITKGTDPEASKYLALNKNTTAQGTPITMAWGRIDLGGHWLSLQSDSNNLSHGTFPTNPT